MTQEKFIEYAQLQLDKFVSRDVYRVCKMSEAEAYTWGMLESYCILSTFQTFAEDYTRMFQDILSYVVIHRISDDDDADVYPHGTELRKLK